jgi:hypothetical protein
MRLSDIPFGTTDWSRLAATEHKGETGLAYWRTQMGTSGFAWSNIRAATWPIIGAAKGISSCAWRASSTPNSPMAAALRSSRE